MFKWIALGLILVGYWLAFALGGVLGMLTSVGIILRLRTALLAANRKLNRLSRNPAPAAVPVPAPAEGADGT